MLTNNAKLRASVIETDGDTENIIRIESNGDTYNVSDVKWVFDYTGPTGRVSKEGLLRAANSNDFRKIIDENIDCKIQINEKKEIILHYINAPE
jgi:hypothetical protein